MAKKEPVAFSVGPKYKDSEAGINSPVRDITMPGANASVIVVAKVYERESYPQEASIVFSVKLSSKEVEKVKEVILKDTEITTFLEVKKVE